MSFEIVNVDIKDFLFLTTRNKKVIGKYLHSIDINQTIGSYITTEPLASPNSIVQYPINPNSVYPIKTVTTILGSSAINLPLDAKYDYIRNRVWVADAGNNRVLLLDSRDFTFIAESKNISLPNSLAIDINTGNCFVKAYNSISKGVVLEISSTGKIISFFEFSTAFPYSDLTIQRNTAWLENMPKTHSISYDYIHFKVWWTDSNFVYMANTLTKTLSIYDLSNDGLYNTKNITTDMESGNAFILASNEYDKWFITQLNKYNSKFLGKAYVEE